MNFEELQHVWQRDAAARQPAPVDAALLAEVRRGSRDFARTIFWRDVREIGASLVVAAVFAKIALDTEADGVPAWPAWVATVLPLLVAVYFLIDRVLTHRRAAPRGETVAAELERAAQAVRHQIWLLRNVLWWYLLPLALCSLMIGLQLVLYAPPFFPVWARWVVIALVLIPTGFFDRWVWQLNQRAVRTELEPRLAELEAHRRELQRQTPPPASPQSPSSDSSPCS